MTNKNNTPNQQVRKFSFTDRRIDQLKQPGNRQQQNQAEYSDVVCIGLKLIHSYLTGRKIFHHRYYHRNKKKTLKVGEYPAVSVELAREICNGNKALLARGLDPVQERTRQAERLTFKEFAEQIYLPHAKTRKRSWADDESKLNRHLYPVLGHLLLADVSRAVLSSYINDISRKTSKSTANRHRALLSSMLNMAVTHEMVDQNRITHIPKFEEPTDHGRALDARELQRLLEALNQAQKPVSALAVKMLLATGMRRSECLKLKWQDINSDQRVAALEMKNTKGKRARTVVLNPSAMAILEELKKYRQPSNPYIFPGERGSHLTSVRKTLESCKKKAGIQNFRLHDCRHTFCSILATSGASLYMIQKLVGHRSPAMTQRYAHLNANDLRDTAKIVSDEMGLALASVC